MLTLLQKLWGEGDEMVPPLTSSVVALRILEYLQLKRIRTWGNVFETFWSQSHKLEVSP